MKRLLLLLIIPTLSYSQITFSDVLSINSLKTFKRVMIENNFEFSSIDSMSLYNIMVFEDYWYGLNIKRDEDGNRSSLWSIYSKHNDEFLFQFVRSGTTKDGRDVVMDTPYDDIIRKIKNRCRYIDIFNRKDLDYVCYQCPQSTFKGYIGFTVNDGVGYVRHIIPTDYDKTEEE